MSNTFTIRCALNTSILFFPLHAAYNNYILYSEALEFTVSIFSSACNCKSIEKTVHFAIAAVQEGAAFVFALNLTSEKRTNQLQNAKETAEKLVLFLYAGCKAEGGKSWPPLSGRFGGSVGFRVDEMECKPINSLVNINGN